MQPYATSKKFTWRKARAVVVGTILGVAMLTLMIWSFLLAAFSMKNPQATSWLDE